MRGVHASPRLGRELMGGGTRYPAHFVPDDEVTADFYETACERLDKVGVPQYEISNFARPGEGSRHNLKYWTRQPYFGFGVDAHSMLASASNSREAVRFALPDALEEYIAGAQPKRTPVLAQAALEEAFFLGLRLNAGVDLKHLVAEFSQSAVHNFPRPIPQSFDFRLLNRKPLVILLTSRGRLLTNAGFERVILDPIPVPCGADTPIRRL